MKYYSDALEKFFATERECLEAESEKEKEAAKDKLIQVEAKRLIQELEEQLDTLCDEAEIALEEADQKVAEIYKDLYRDYQPRIEALRDKIKEARDNMNDCTTEKHDFKFNTSDGGVVEGSYEIHSSKDFVKALTDIFNKIVED